MTDFIRRRINKEVSFRFAGKDLIFCLSMGLFSSFDVDSGTKLLLKNIAGHIDFPNINRVLDAGSGTGTVAVSLKKAYPDISMTALDRDALALAFTSYNARMNDTAVETIPGLDTSMADAASLTFGDTGSQGWIIPGTAEKQELQDKNPASLSAGKPFLGPRAPYDLIVTNIPAKAGEPVLERFIRNSNAMLVHNGYFAVVIVAPLREIAERMIPEAGFTITAGDHTVNHSVFIARKAPGSKAADISLSFPGPYRRYHNYAFSTNNSNYFLDTMFDIPGFDTIPFKTAPAAALADPGKIGNPDLILFWNPGQGHTAVQVLQRFINPHEAMGNGKGSGISCIVAGRDLLALLATRENLQNNFPGLTCITAHLPGLEYLPECIGSCDIAGAANTRLAVIEPDTIPGCSLNLQLAEGLSVIPAGEPDENTERTTGFGQVILTGKSAEIGRVTPRSFGMSPRQSRKSSGFRAIRFSRLKVR